MAPVPSSCAPMSVVYRQKSWDSASTNSKSDEDKKKLIKSCAADPCFDSMVDDDPDEGCKTPKSTEHRLPEEAVVCPPAPKKPHLHCKRFAVPPVGGYFSSPELEVFFNQLEISTK